MAALSHKPPSSPSSPSRASPTKPIASPIRPPLPPTSHIVGTTGIKITLPPSVVARHLAAQRQNRVDIPDLQLSSSGALMTHTAPLSALVSSSADMAARPLHEPAPFSIPRDSAAAIVAEEPTALLLSPRINETPDESGKGAGIGPFGGVPLSPASLVPPPQLVVNTNHHMQIIDVSHTLAADATVYSVLSGCTSDAQSGRLIMGTTVTKHNAAAAGGFSRRKIYVNFDDNTLRVMHTVPLIQSFMSESKGVFYLYTCYAACPWEKSSRGKERMLRNRTYLDENMKKNTLCLVQRGGPESLVISFDTHEEYEFWLSGLRLLQMQSYQYHTFMRRELQKASTNTAIKRMGQSKGVWASILSMSRKAREKRKAMGRTEKEEAAQVAECVKVEAAAVVLGEEGADENEGGGGGGGGGEAAIVGKVEVDDEPHNGNAGEEDDGAQVQRARELENAQVQSARELTADPLPFGGAGNDKVIGDDAGSEWAVNNQG